MTIKILHISDLHFVLDPQANIMQTLLLKEASAVASFPVGQKLLVITGDFHNFKNNDYHLAEKFLPQLFKAMAIDPTQDVFVVPGNHDIGNPTVLGKRFASEKYWKRIHESALNEIAEGKLDDENLEIRLQDFLPYCDFVRDLEIYSNADGETYPAQVHVRPWRDKLNILHLNTALGAKKGVKDNQRLDTREATGEEIWAGKDTGLPALALGHNSYFDLAQEQQDQLAVPFLSHAVSAYLCGDTHRTERDAAKQMIRLFSGYENVPEIPNVVCPKGIAEETDDYSEFGWYWHDWNTDSGEVTLTLCRWRSKDRNRVSKESFGYYKMLGKTTPPPEASAEPEPSPAAEDEPSGVDDLHRYLDDSLERVRREHPSFRLMRPDELDERLFPHVGKVEAFEARGTRDEDGKPGSVWELIAESWQQPGNRSIVIEGGGGIGKTVTLLSPSVPLPAPALYLHLYELVEDGKPLTLSEYLQKKLPEWAENMLRLAAQPREHGPSLILLLDGFNEIPAQHRREVLKKLNEWRTVHPGAQFIAVSRPMDGLNLVKELAGEPIGVTLKPLNEAEITAYLNAQGVELPEDASPLWEVLGYPLFLTLYVKTGKIMESERANAGYPLDFKPARSKGAVIWNYLQRELLRKTGDESWVLSCALACEHILPRIAWEMLKEQSFTIERRRAVKLIQEALLEIQVERLPVHLSQIRDCYEYIHFYSPDLSCAELKNLDWNNLVLREISLLLPDKQKNSTTPTSAYSFPHQNFRDCLAGLYLVDQAEAAENMLPEVWTHTPNLLALDYAAELMDRNTAGKLWETNRTLDPTDPAATYSMLELQRRRSEEERPALSFSGMDLRGLSLARYCEQDGTDLGLFRDPDLSKETKLDAACFRSQGHSGKVNCLAVTENGLCVSGSNDKTLRVWDLRSGDCLHTLNGHKGSVTCVAVTEEGLCVSGSRDKALRVWDLRSGNCLHTLYGHSASVLCVAVTADGLCVSGSSDATLRVWDLRSGVCLHMLEGHILPVNCVAVTEVGLCISGSADNTLRVWNLHSGNCLHTLEGHSASVSCVAVAEGGLSVSGSNDKILRVWDFCTGDCLYELWGHDTPVRCVAVTADGLCVSGSDDGMLRVWDVYSGNCLHTLAGHKRSISCVAVTRDGLCVSHSSDNTLHVWDVYSGACLHTLEGRGTSVRCVAVTKDGLCVSGSDNKTLRVWDVHSGECLHALEGHSEPVNCIAVIKDGLCVSDSRDNTLYIWDIRSGVCFYELMRHCNSANGVVASEDCLCVGGSLDDTLSVLNFRSGRYLSMQAGHRLPINCVAVTKNGLCVSGSDDCTLCVRDIHSGEYLHMLAGHGGPVNCVAVTKDGLCISGSLDKTLRIWDLHSGTCLNMLVGHGRSVSCVALTTDGLCVSGSLDKTLRVWDLRSGNCLRTLIRHNDWVKCVAVTEDGLCVSGSDDKTLRVWDLYSGDCLHTLKGHSDSVNCVAVTENGYCISGSLDNTLRVWDIHAGKCLTTLHLSGICVSGMDFSEAVFDPLDPVLDRVFPRNRFGALPAETERRSDSCSPSQPLPIA